MFSIPENAVVITGTPPVTTNGGITCDNIWVKNFHKIYVVASLTQAVAHATGIDPVQSSALAGGDAKALSEVCRIWYVSDVEASDVPVLQDAAKTFNVDADVAKMMVIFEIIPEQHMDVNEEFCVLGCTLDNSGQASNLANVLYIGVPRYQQEVPPTAIE